MNGFNYSLFLLIGITLVAPIKAEYAVLETPTIWTFSKQSPAYEDLEKTTLLGNFQAGIRVRVLSQILEQNLWHVRYESPNRKPIHAYIDRPISAIDQRNPNYHSFLKILEGFPLLDALLKEADPWALSPTYLSETYFNTKANNSSINSSTNLGIIFNERFLNHSAKTLKNASIWEWNPKELYIDYRNENRHRITINLWNRGDSKLKWKTAYKQLDQLIDRFKQLESLLGNANSNYSMREKIPTKKINALRQNIDYFFLANDLIIQLRWSRNEFISIDLLSYTEQTRTGAHELEIKELKATLKESVLEAPDGHLVIANIPMICQGDKGYCATASLARILQYYGYPVSLHSLSELAETSATEGTTIDEIFSSIQRICNSTPFKIQTIDNPRRHELVDYIKRGIPLYWIIPGHARLINGIHPEGGIIFTDSWGAGHEFKLMTWSQFKNLNKTVFALELE